jgi:hypothetical protein
MKECSLRLTDGGTVQRVRQFLARRATRASSGKVYDRGGSKALVIAKIEAQKQKIGGRAKASEDAQLPDFEGMTNGPPSQSILFCEANFTSVAEDRCILA